MEVEQVASEGPTDYGRNKKGNKNIHRSKWKWKHDNPKPMGFSKSSAGGRFIAIQAYLKKQEKNQISNLTLHLNQLEKEVMKSPGVSRRKEIIKIRAEINEKKTKETMAKINKTIL